MCGASEAHTTPTFIGTQSSTRSCSGPEQLRKPRSTGHRDRSSCPCRPGYSRAMATVSCHIDADPDTVFAVLAEGWLYSNWVVGTSHVRAVEEAWPAQGSKLHHASGAWPLVARDETVVERVEKGRVLVLVARGRPVGEARVSIELAPSGGGTTVTMNETPVAGPGK